MTRIHVPPALTERPTDPAYDVPVPFACEFDDNRRDVGGLNRKRVIQCALSRVCGMCGASLEWRVGFVGSADEANRNAFHFPPLHVACAEAALAIYPTLNIPVLGQDARLSEWALIVTGGFELERPASRLGDQRVVFHPSAITSDRRVQPG